MDACTSLDVHSVAVAVHIFGVAKAVPYPIDQGDTPTCKR